MITSAYFCGITSFAFLFSFLFFEVFIVFDFVFVVRRIEIAAAESVEIFFQGVDELLLFSPVI